MLKTVWAVISHGKIEPLEPVSLSEGTKVLVTLLPDEDERGFWLAVSESALAKIWDNNEDNIYAELL